MLRMKCQSFVISIHRKTWGQWNEYLKVWYLKGTQKDLNRSKRNMMTSSNGNIFRVTGLFCGELPAQRPVTRSFDVYFDLRLNKRLSKQSRGWWFETLSGPLGRHYNVKHIYTKTSYYICLWCWKYIQNSLWSQWDLFLTELAYFGFVPFKGISYTASVVTKHIS